MKERAFRSKASQRERKPHRKIPHAYLDAKDSLPEEVRERWLVSTRGRYIEPDGFYYRYYTSMNGDVGFELRIHGEILSPADFAYIMDTIDCVKHTVPYEMALPENARVVAISDRECHIVNPDIEHPVSVLRSTFSKLENPNDPRVIPLRWRMRLNTISGKIYATPYIGRFERLASIFPDSSLRTHAIADFELEHAVPLPVLRRAKTHFSGAVMPVPCAEGETLQDVWWADKQRTISIHSEHPRIECSRFEMSPTLLHQLMPRLHAYERQLRNIPNNCYWWIRIDDNNQLLALLCSDSFDRYFQERTLNMGSIGRTTSLITKHRHLLFATSLGGVRTHIRIIRPAVEEAPQHTPKQKPAVQPGDPPEAQQEAPSTTITDPARHTAPLEGTLQSIRRREEVLPSLEEHWRDRLNRGNPSHTMWSENAELGVDTGRQVPRALMLDEEKLDE